MNAASFAEIKVKNEDGDIVTICVQRAGFYYVKVFVAGGLLADGSDEAVFSTFELAIAFASREATASFHS